MTNTNKHNAISVEVNDNGTGNCNETKAVTVDTNSASRSFSASDLWSIRRNSRTFKIHNRIPRL